MIIFYHKKTGKIAGTIEGRVHNEDHHKMFIGDPKDNDRVVCNWVKGVSGKFEPEDPIFLDMEASRSLTTDFVVDLKTKKVVRA